ncbi:MAG: isocitrate/isopropylmalate family dehydrogenase, partial [Natronospirillum sp.]
AFDIMGKGIANPVGSFWTAVMMLEHLGETSAAEQLMAAIERLTGSGLHTPDLGGYATTELVTSAICQDIEQQQRKYS